MKKNVQIIFAFLLLFVFLHAPVGPVAQCHAQQANTGYLENVLFESMSGRERVSLIVSAQPVIAPPSLQADNSLLIKMEDMFVPENLRDILGKGQMKNIIDVKASQRTVSGKQWIYLKINLRERVPYTIQQEGNAVVIDFNVSGAGAQLSSGSPTEGDARKTAANDAAPVFKGRKITVDFQDADIKSVLRLMAEYGNVSIISGDDVKGNVTLTIKDVPWDHALGSILEIKGLAQKQTGNVISVMTLERKKKDEAEKRKMEEDQIKADEARKEKQQKMLAEKGKLRQILIEAKIVEATEGFGRNLGIQWGFGNMQNIREYGLGVSGGSNPINQTNAQTQAYPPEINWTKSGSTDPLTMAAVNFPAAILGPSLGIVFGNSRGFFEAQLAALETNSSGKVISSPKVVTMDGEKAIIKQGDEVPYITPGKSAGDAATVSFKDALLKLEVTPKITEEGKISMVITANNDWPDYAKASLNPEGNPPIRKSEVNSKVVLADGDTLVIGGITQTSEDKTVSGWPWLQKIPVLGWLFKTEDINKSKKQLMIFVTPKILAGEAYDTYRQNSAAP